MTSTCNEKMNVTRIQVVWNSFQSQWQLVLLLLLMKLNQTRSFEVTGVFCSHESNVLIVCFNQMYWFYLMQFIHLKQRTKKLSCLALFIRLAFITVGSLNLIEISNSVFYLIRWNIYLHLSIPANFHITTERDWIELNSNGHVKLIILE